MQKIQMHGLAQIHRYRLTDTDTYIQAQRVQQLPADCRAWQFDAKAIN